MNRVSTSSALTATLQVANDRFLAGRATQTLSQKEMEVREKFQDFVAGTFFKQMFKALRKSQGQPAYFHGGQAEEMFQSQLDQQVAEDVARTHGAPLSDSLFEAYLQKRRGVFRL